jgi:predicted flavoprotein YhiN
VATALIGALDVRQDVAVAQVPRSDRRPLAHALIEWSLPVTDTRGYTFAEATAGGVPLSEVDATTLESRVCRGLYLVGEVLDVDGRIGGFNFQWAWSSARVAARGLAVT